jgi:peptide/nickel transport system permease protein
LSDGSPALTVGVPQARSADVTRTRRRREWAVTLRDTMALIRTKAGIALFVFVLGVAVLGPLIAPYSPTEFVGKPFQLPSASAWLGTDYIGHDVLSRVLCGGRTVFSLSLAATLIGMALGTGFGLVAAYANKWVDEIIMRLLDVLMAFPAIVFVLLVVSIAGPKLYLIVLAVALGHAPRVARVARGSALEIVDLDFVKASEALGTPRIKIMLGEILPNISSPLLVEAGLRFAYSIGLIAALSFLGFGLQPPAADWGLMVNENRPGIYTQPYAVLAPIVLIALLTVGTSLVTDGFARALIGIDRRTHIE